MNEEIRQLDDVRKRLSDKAHEAMSKVGENQTEETLKDWALRERAARLASETLNRTLLRHLREIHTVVCGKYE